MIVKLFILTLFLCSLTPTLTKTSKFMIVIIRLVKTHLDYFQAIKFSSLAPDWLIAAKNIFKQNTIDYGNSNIHIRPS